MDTEFVPSLISDKPTFPGLTSERATLFCSYPTELVGTTVASLQGRPV